MFRKVSLVAGLLALHATCVLPAVVTFDHVIPEIHGEVHEDGFVVSTVGAFYVGGSLFCSPPCPDNGTQILMVQDGTIPIHVQAEDGAPFRLLRFDVGEQHLTIAPAPLLYVTAHRVDGTDVTLSFPIDGINDGPGPLQDMQTYAGPGVFGEVTSVDFSVPPPISFHAYSLDNLVLGPQPTIVAVPALSRTGVLMLVTLLAAAALVLVRRRAVA